MKQHYYYRVLLFLILFTIFISYEAYIYSAAFERIGIGARAQGMSGAFTGLGNDVSGIYYNTAGLVNITEDQLEFMYNNLYGLSLVNYTFIGYARPHVGEGTISMGWIHMGLGDEFQLRNFTEDTVLLGYGFCLLKDVNLGFSLKYYGASYDGMRGAAWGADVSCLYNLNEILLVGVNIQDINFPLIKWENKTKDRLPLNVNTGLSLKMTKLFTLSGDLKNIFNYERTYCVGGELELIQKMLFIRAGGAYQKVLSFSFGFGLFISNFQFQYSTQRHSDLGWNNIMGLTIYL